MTEYTAENEKDYPEEEEKTYHITTLVNEQAEAIMNILKRGPSFTFKDKSMPGVSILEVYSNLNPEAMEYWE